jgi:uncharacterized membrane protein YpjA
MAGTVWHPKLWGARRSRRNRWYITRVRWYIGLVGMIALWTGLNDFFDYFVWWPTVVRESVFIVTGESCALHAA